MSPDTVSLLITVVALWACAIALVLIDERRHPWASLMAWRLSVVTGGVTVAVGVIYALTR